MSVFSVYILASRSFFLLSLFLTDTWHRYWDKSSVGQKDVLISSLTVHTLLHNTSLSFLSWQEQLALLPLLSPPLHITSRVKLAWFFEIWSWVDIFLFYNNRSKTTLMNELLIAWKETPTYNHCFQYLRTKCYDISNFLLLSSLHVQTNNWMVHNVIFSVNLRNVGNWLK